LGFGLALPLSAIVNLAVKSPVIEQGLFAWNIPESLVQWPWWFAGLSLLLVGISEELFKLLPAMFLLFRRTMINPTGVAAMAAAVGFGFGIGEIWYLAWRLSAAQPEVASLPFYMLGGFMGERALAVWLHAILLQISLSGLSVRPAVVALTALGAALLHALSIVNQDVRFS
jgi:hypothetical protein